MDAHKWALLAALAALWGGTYALNKLLLDELPPPVVVAWRVGLAAVVLLPAAVWSGVLGSLRGRWGAMAIVVLTQATLPLLLLTFGQRGVPAGVAGVLGATQPIFVAMLAGLAGPYQRPGAIGATGLLLGLLGVGLLFRAELGVEVGAVVGGLLVLASALSFTTGSVLLYRWLGDAAPLAVAAVAMGSTALLLVPVLPLAQRGMPPNPRTLLELVLLGAVCTGLGLHLFYWLIARIGPVRANLSVYLAPAFAVLYCLLFLDETLTVATGAGLVLVVLGAWLAARGSPAQDLGGGARPPGGR